MSLLIQIKWYIAVERYRKELEVIWKVERCRSLTGVGWSVPELPGATLERARSNTFDLHTNHTYVVCIISEASSVAQWQPPLQLIHHTIATGSKPPIPTHTSIGGCKVVQIATLRQENFGRKSFDLL